jgi:hypothetical protein
MNLQVADLGSAPIASLGGYVPAAKDNGGVDQLIQAFLGGALGSMGSELGQNIMANDVSAEAAKQGLGPGEQGAFKRWFSPYTKGDLKADRADSMDKQRMSLEKDARTDTKNYQDRSLGLQSRQIDETAKDRAARIAQEDRALAAQTARWEDEYGFKRADSMNDKATADARLSAENDARNRSLSLQEKELNLKTSLALGYGRDEIDMETGLPKVKPTVVAAAGPTGMTPQEAEAAMNAAKQPRPESRASEFGRDALLTVGQIGKDIYNDNYLGPSLKDLNSYLTDPTKPALPDWQILQRLQELGLVPGTKELDPNLLKNTGGAGARW